MRVQTATRQPTASATESPTRLEVSLTIPLGDLAPVSLPPRKIELSLRSPRDAQSAQAVARLRDGLRDRHTQLTCGRHVETIADTIRWLLEGVYTASCAAGSQKAGHRS